MMTSMIAALVGRIAILEMPVRFSAMMLMGMFINIVVPIPIRPAVKPTIVVSASLLALSISLVCIFCFGCMSQNFGYDSTYSQVDDCPHNGVYNGRSQRHGFHDRILREAEIYLC